MARGSFNTTCDIYCGPGSATPGVLKGTADCRLVLADAIFLQNPNAPDRQAWLTIIDIEPIDSFAPTLYTIDLDLADQIAVPSGTAPQWAVLYTDNVLWQSQPLYYRANLIPLPLPHGDAIIQETGDLILQETLAAILVE